MWSARILDGLSWNEFSELNLYDGFDKYAKRSNEPPPMLLLGRALVASDGGGAAAALFVSLSDGERWCAHTVGQALAGYGASRGEPGMGSTLACER